MADDNKYFKTYEGNYDVNELINKLYKNSARYAEWRKERDLNFDINSFNDSLNKIATEIQNGTLSRGKGRRYFSSALTDISTASDSAALDLVNRVIDNITKVPEPELEKFNDKYSLRTEFLNKFYAGNSLALDLSLWTNGTYGAEDLADMVDAYTTKINNANLDYSNSPYTDKNDLIARAKKLSLNLRNGSIDMSDSADWVALGGEKKIFDTIFKLGPKELTPWEKEWKEKEKLYISAGKDNTYINNQRNKFFLHKLDELNAPYNRRDYAEAFAKFATDHWKWTGSAELVLKDVNMTENEVINLATTWSGITLDPANNNRTIGWMENIDNANYADQLYLKACKGEFTNNSLDGLTDDLILYFYMKMLKLTDSENMFININLDGSEVFLKGSIDLDTGTAIKYNFNTNVFSKVHVRPSGTPVLLRILKGEYRTKYPFNEVSSTNTWGNIFSDKNGGRLLILKTLRNGGNILYALSGALLAEIQKRNRLATYELSVKDRALAKNLSEEDIKKGDVKASEDNSFNSWLRAASTVLDVAGAGASFIPVVGNAVGAVLGTVGTVGNLVADALDDSVSRDEMIQNLLVNGALTGLMLIPTGGTASLATKALKVGKAVVLAGAPIYAGTLVYQNWDRVKELWDKREKGTISHAEERELYTYISMMSGTVTGTKAAAAKGAKYLGNNFAGKTAAVIADPYLAASAYLGGDKRAKVVFRNMLKGAKPVKTNANSNKKGVNYEFEDADGNKFLINKKQYDAMRKAEAEGRKAGLSGEELDRKIGDAWAKYHTDGPKTYAVDETIQQKLWNVSDTDANVKQQLTADVDPTGNVEIGGISFSKESVKALKQAYKTAAESVTDEAIKAARGLDAVSDDVRTAYKHEIGMKAAREKFASLAESSEVIPGRVLEGNPIFGMSDTGKFTKGLRHVGVGRSDLNINDLGESAMSRFFNSSDGDIFDYNSSIGRENLHRRALFRDNARKYLSESFLFRGIGNKGADFLLDRFNTNWELAHNMGGLRRTSDEVLDSRIKKETLSGKSKLANQERRSNFVNSDEGKRIIRAKERELDRPLTRDEIQALSDKHELLKLRNQQSVENARANAEGKLGDNTDISTDQMMEILSNVRDWKKLSYELIKNQYDTAVSAGFDGDIVAYSRHVKDLKKLGKTIREIHQDNLDKIAVNKLSAEKELILKNFEKVHQVDPVRVAAEARTLGFTGDDATIIKLLQDSFLNAGTRDDIVAKLKKANKSASTRRKNLDYTRELLSNGAYKMLVQKYKGQNPTKSEAVALRDLLRLIRNNNKTLKEVLNQYTIPSRNKQKVENAILNMLDLSELYSIISRFKLVKKSKLGGRLDRLIELRKNFIIDNSYTSDGLSRFKNGGILKGEKGLVFPEWYKKLYTQNELDNWQQSQESTYNGSLKESDFRTGPSNLELAYKYNDAYIGSNHITEDIQSYFNNTNHETIDEFIKDYNNKIKLIDERWKTNRQYKGTGAREGNLAYRDLFSSSLNNKNIYYLGYDENVEDVYGPTTWLRRADKYEKELDDPSLSEEELRSRKHIIKDKNGIEHTVYKNADGTITLTAPPKYETVVDRPGNTEGDDDFDEDDRSSGSGDGGGVKGSTTSDSTLELIEYLINKHIPDQLSGIRLIKNLRNNRKLQELGKRKRANYLNYIQGHENVYGDFGALMSGQLTENNLLSNANRFAESTTNLELAAAMLLESLLKANDSKKYYTNVDNATIAKSKTASQAAEQERYLENLRRAETNAGTSVAKHNADLDIDMGTNAANTTNWNTLLSEQESRFRLKNVDDRELLEKLAMLDIQQWWKNNVTDTPHILDLLTLYPKADATRLAEIIKEVQKERQQNELLYSDERVKRLRKIMKGDYWGIGTGNDYFSILKKGGKVDDSRIKRRAEDLKELRKLIRHSITTNQKALDNLSKATLLELKRMMGI